jgi:plasmid stabilization system protein ParE
MIVRFAPRALADIERIRKYLVPRNPQGAERVRRAVAEAIDRCALNPNIGSKTDEHGVYRRALRKYRYTILYRLLPAGEGIEIARIIYSARVKKLGTLPLDD